MVPLSDPLCARHFCDLALAVSLHLPPSLPPSLPPVSLFRIFVFFCKLSAKESGVPFLLSFGLRLTQSFHPELRKNIMQAQFFSLTLDCHLSCVRGLDSNGTKRAPGTEVLSLSVFCSFLPRSCHVRTPPTWGSMPSTHSRALLSGRLTGSHRWMLLDSQLSSPARG